MADALKNAFMAFASYGKGQELKQDMDNKNFSKTIKDCGLMDAKVITSTEVDLIFTKIKDKAARTINFLQFQKGLDMIAQKKGIPRADVDAKIISSGGPTSNATKAEAVKYHDDKTLYTGVHGKGGPTTVDRSKDLSSLCDRSPADNRGVKYSAK